MANGEIRVTGLPSDDNLVPGDCVMVDSTTEQSRRFDLGTELTNLKSDIGDLADLETTDTSSLVAAINEAASSGGGGSIDTLTDVELTNLSNGQALTYDSTEQVWKNVTLGGGGSITIDSALSTSSENPVQNKVITNALNVKADTSNLATVATSGSYNDLSNKPTIPSAGIPSGGTAGQFLVKSSSTDYDVVWMSLSTWQGGNY